ncbi:MAG: helix-turn-helix domain-containing protein [Rhodocyclaceae bacterium]|nr:helix-turn-helix domain-containing protein [Rhodocyclaceae bacterium]
MSLFKKLKDGLSEALEFERGNESLAVRVRAKPRGIAPLERFTPRKIRSLRASLNMSQQGFANLLGVSIETLAKWDKGVTTPSGSSSRLLQILKKRPGLAAKLVLVSEL